MGHIPSCKWGRNPLTRWSYNWVTSVGQQSSCWTGFCSLYYETWKMTETSESESSKMFKLRNIFSLQHPRKLRNLKLTSKLQSLQNASSQVSQPFSMVVSSRFSSQSFDLNFTANRKTWQAHTFLKRNLGGGFKYFLFSSVTCQFDFRIFFRWVGEKPPTRNGT